MISMCENWILLGDLWTQWTQDAERALQHLSHYTNSIKVGSIR